MSAIQKLREIDAQIVTHVLERGKLWEKRQKVAQQLAGTSELKTYQAELAEWLGEMNTQIEGDQS